MRAEPITAEQAHRRAAAAIAEQRQSIDGDARGANLLKYRPKRLRHALEMRRIKRSGEGDREAVLAQHVRIAETFKQESLILAERGACMLGALGVGRRRG